MFEDLIPVASIKILDTGIDSITCICKFFGKDRNSQAALAYEEIFAFLRRFKANKPAIPTEQKVELTFYDKENGNMDCTFFFEPPVENDEAFNSSISQSILAVHEVLKRFRESGATEKSTVTKVSNDGAVETIPFHNPKSN